MRKREKQNLKSENAAIRISLYGAIFFLVVESLMAIYTSSQSILMDAVYGAADMVMILISVKIVPLLYRPMSEKHPFGFSQVEAIFLTLKGTMLAAVTLALVLNNIQIMIKGGNQIEFAFVAAFEMLAAAVIGIILLLLIKSNKKLNSPMIKMEIDAWIIDLVATLGIAVAFILPELITTEWMQGFAPYLDQVVAILLSVLILPLPIKLVIQGLRDVFLLAPDAKTIAEIKEICHEILKKHTFHEAEYDIIKTGRKIWISIYFKSPTDQISVKEIVRTQRELETALHEEFNFLYVELIPEFENL